MRQTHADVYMLLDRCKCQMHPRASSILYSTLQRAGNIFDRRGKHMSRLLSVGQCRARIYVIHFGAKLGCKRVQF